MLHKIMNPYHRLESWQKTLYLMLVVQVLSATGFSTIFPFLPLYVEELGSVNGWSVEFSVGVVYAVSNFSMMFASPIWGALSDRFGRKIMVQRATFGAAILIFLMAFARSAEDLVIIRAVQGLFTGVVSAISALVASQAPRERMGYAMGMIQVGLWGGVALGPVIGGAIADATSYQTTIVVTAILLAGSGFLVSIVKENFTPIDKGQQKPKSMLANWGQIITTPGVSTTLTLRFMSNLARMAIYPILPLFLATLLTETDGFNTFTGLMFGVTAAASTATAVYLGKLGDRIGHRKIVLACAFLTGALYILQSQVGNEWQLFILQGLTGAAAGGILPALSALLARYTKPGEEGSVYGIDNGVGAGGRAVSPLVGSGVAILFDLRSAFVATGIVFMGIGAIALFFLPKSEAIVHKHKEEGVSQA
ncbi:MAG: MFS transporter [Chloroflexota bacterium]